MGRETAEPREKCRRLTMQLAESEAQAEDARVAGRGGSGGASAGSAASQQRIRALRQRVAVLEDALQKVNAD